MASSREVSVMTFSMGEIPISVPQVWIRSLRLSRGIYFFRASKVRGVIRTSRHRLRIWIRACKYSAYVFRGDMDM